MTSADADTTRRLAHVRLLLGRALEESRASPPFCYDSLGRLHDALEMFLALAAQHHHKAIPKDFMKYWEVLEPALGRPLLYRAQSERFNKARVGWKHYGTEPAISEVEAARATVEGLLTDECLPLFGLELSEASLTSFVRPESARDLTHSAEMRWAAGDEAEAFADLIDAFDEMLRDYEQRKMTSYNHSVFGPQNKFTFLTPFSRGIPFGKEQQFVDAVIGSLEAHDRNIKIVGFGLDLRRYGRFVALTPHLVRNISGGRITSERMRKELRTFEQLRSSRSAVTSLCTVRFGSRSTTTTSTTRRSTRRTERFTSAGVARRSRMRQPTAAEQFQYGCVRRRSQ